jgi:hypothetical protein
MRLFKKKDKRYNSQLDNYIDKYADTFKLGLVYVIIGGIAYLIYNLFY